jgi:predicted nucleic acid-binding protein
VRLVDTDVLVEHLRGSPHTTALLTGDDLHISVLTRFELLAGMRSAERHVLRALVDAIPNLAVTTETSVRAGAWAREYRRSHSKIGPIDYLIAATAEVHGAQLVTQNVKDYPMFPGLEAPF